MTVCNMAIEAGARVRPCGGRREDDRICARSSVRAAGRDVRTGRRGLAHVADRSGRALRLRRRVARRGDQASGDVGHLTRDGDYDRRCRTRSREPNRIRRSARVSNVRCATWGSAPKTRIADIRLDKVFIGSCTNSRIEDLREAAWVVKRLGKRVAPSVKLAMVVPGSGLVKAQAEREGLRRRVSRGRLRMARARLFDVPGDERRSA